MTDQWTAVKAPFADPSNPDIAVKTLLWDGAPRPQNEVGGEPRVGMASKDAFLRTVSDVQDAIASEIDKLMIPRVQSHIADDWQDAMNYLDSFQYWPQKIAAEYIPTRTERMRDWAGDRLTDLAGWIEDLVKGDAGVVIQWGKKRKLGGGFTLREEEEEEPRDLQREIERLENVILDKENEIWKLTMDLEEKQNKIRELEEAARR